MGRSYLLTQNFPNGEITLDVNGYMLLVHAVQELQS